MIYDTIIPEILNYIVKDCRIGMKILDVGHLRYFTYRTAKKLLEDNGYKIISVVNNNMTLPIRFLRRIYKSLFAFQFVLNVSLN